MEQRHQEYVEYYYARLKKYQNNPMYPHSAAAERALYDAISTASTLEEFGERLRAGKLDLACAIARERDVANVWVKVYEQRCETVRAQPHLEVLRNLDATTYDNVNDLVSMVTEVHTRWNIPISMDEHLRDEFWGDWKIIEDIEEDQRAEVLASWHAERQESAQRELSKGAEHWTNHTLPAARDFDPNYQPDWSLLTETRHRRLFPLADPVVQRRIEDHKRYVGAK